MNTNKAKSSIWKHILFFLFPHLFSGCLFETSSAAFDGYISSVTLVKQDERTATYSVKYNGWSTVDSLGIFVQFETCKQNARFVNNKLEAIYYTNLQPWESEKTFPSGRFEGIESVTWTLDHGDTIYIQLQMFTKPQGAVGFSQRIIVQKQF